MQGTAGKFIGTYVRRIDGARRILLPKEYLRIIFGRHGEESNFPHIFFKKSSQANALEWVSDEMMEYGNQADLRTLFDKFSNLHRVILYNDGRVKIPKEIDKEMQFERRAVITGIGETFLIWSMQDFDVFLRDHNK